MGVMHRLMVGKAPAIADCHKSSTVVRAVRLLSTAGISSMHGGETR